MARHHFAVKHTYPEVGATAVTVAMVATSSLLSTNLGETLHTCAANEATPPKTVEMVLDASNTASKVLTSRSKFRKGHRSLRSTSANYPT